MNLDLTGRRVLVVGASMGIGRAIAARAVGAGAEVVFAARRQEVLDEAIAESGGGHVAIGDVSTAEGCRQIVDQAVTILSALDLVVYAAGMSPMRPMRLTSAEEWFTVLSTNVVGASLVTSACLDHLVPEGIVAFLSSDSAFKPRYSLVPYAASKAALEVTIKGWRTEHPDHRFVNVVVGPTGGTDFASNFEMDEVTSAFPIWLRHAEVPLKMMTPEALASVLLSALGSALDNPEVDVQDIVLRPPGGIASSFEDLLAQAQEKAQ